MVSNRTMELASEYTRLLADVAPELALRGILHDCGAAAPPPALYRVLVSILLRASDVGIADSVYEVLKSSPAPAALAGLGFTHLTAPGEIRSIVKDILSSLVRDKPLQPSNAALEFYSVAGVGTADPDEFKKPGLDGLSADFGEPIFGLADTRRRSLVLAVEYFSTVVLSGPNRESCSMCLRDSRLISELIGDIRTNIAHMKPSTLSAAHSFLYAMLDMADDKALSDAVVVLVTAFQDIAVKDPQSLITFMSGLKHTDIKFRACVMYLKQRFGARRVGSCDSKTLQVKQFLHYFMRTRIVKSRPNVVLPAVLTSLVQAWLADADSSCFKIDNPSIQGPKVLNGLSERKEVLIEKCKPNERDETDFHLAIMAVGVRVMVANSSSDVTMS